jgi:hypothetical protein
MNRIKRCIIILLLSILGNTAIAQSTNCDKLKMSKSDKILLMNFWSEFGRAINTKSKLKLTSLIKFPFECGYCPKAKKMAIGVDFLVNKQIFYQEYYKIFFGNKLKKTINESSMLENIHIYFDGEKCIYTVGFVSIEPSHNSEGQGTVFILTKIKGKFIITETYTIP